MYRNAERIFFMVIQLPDWDGWRIYGESLAWEIQVQQKKGKKAGEWNAVRWFPSLDSAVACAYEKALKENGLVTGDLREAEKECRKVKDSLLKAVRKAVVE